MLAWALVLQLLQLHADAPLELWNYDDPAAWKTHFPLCDGPLQSPIDLVPTPCSRSPQIERVKVDFAPGLKNGEIMGMNTGRNIKLFFRPENITAPLMQLTFPSKPKFGTYRFLEMVFHWGEELGDHGSEHTIDGKFFDAEVQMVFFSDRYGTYEEARKHPAGLTIVAVPLSADLDRPVPHLTFPIFQLDVILEDLAPVNSTILIEADLTPMMGMMQTALTRYYSYYGSLTAPPCNPVVLWLVSSTEMSLQLEFIVQLYAEIFQDDLLGRKLVMNRRSIQPSMRRVVTVCSEP
ncbi:carbonic anhydrase-like [Pollicipes pollicipes]|uniref:carbonic anhydrase-like n=1 Tax=Pollicipes pollicipes TaxID=41117 RepID=UPI001884D7C7|nr:carbonic anhydrase-like [Pollicipes pollicipes]